MAKKVELTLVERYTRLHNWSADLLKNPKTEISETNVLGELLGEWIRWGEEQTRKHNVQIGQLKEKLKESEKLTAFYRQSVDDLRASNGNLMTSNQELEKDKKALEQEIEELKSELNTEKERLEKEIKEIKSESKSEKERLEKENRGLEKNQLKRYDSHRKDRRGGCKLTDREIKQLLMIYAKRGEYAQMSLNQAIRLIALTHRTYYKVIKRKYASDATNERIERIASENGIILPRRVKTA